LSFVEKLNKLGSQCEPFFFMINYEMSDYEIIPLALMPDNIKYSFQQEKISNTNKKLDFKPPSLQDYTYKFNSVINNIKKGNTYLLNLTQVSKVNTNYSIEEIYNIASARFKLLYKDKFVCFTPERFINIKDNKIYTYPMKGTINANIPDAKKMILSNPKELAEHTMVVDLLRNDLSIVAQNVKVDRFRYCEEVQAGCSNLIQVSSQISGSLDKSWKNNIGNILNSLLPAGSITGTPKRKTIDLIDKIEDYDRDYFTGICGIFDGKSLESFVMIRFIEKQKDGTLLYKSGGGITCDSNIKEEYQEMCNKVYIP
jgi:para-aminobenzoate synthetase component 1